MTSEIRANTLKNRVGLGTIEYSNTGPVISGVTTSNNFKTGSTNVHSVGVEAAGINVLGADTPIGTGATIYNSGAAVFTGVVTATSFSGSGDLDVDGHTNLDNISIAGVSTFTGVSDHSSRLQMLAGNPIRLLNDGNSAHCEIDCYGGAGFRLTSYNQTMFTCENGSNTKFYTDSGTSRLEITHAGHVLVNTGDLYIPDKLIHSGDTDTCVRFPANNQISFETNGVERFRIRADGNVGIGSDNPQAEFEVFGHSSAASGAAPILAIRNGYSGTADASNALKSEIRFLHKNHNAAHEFMAARIIADTTNNYSQLTTLRFLVAQGNNGTERLTIDSAGRVYIGHTSNIAVAGSNPHVQVTGTTDGTAHLSIRNFSANTTGAILSLAKSRGSVGAYTAVQDDDVLGQINFAGADGTDLAEVAGKITVACDATVAGNRIPSRMEFHTTDGNGNLDLNMVITRDGQLYLPQGITRDAMYNLAHSTANDLILGRTTGGADTGMTLVSPSATSGFINFADADGQRQGSIVYQHGSGSDKMFFRTNNNTTGLIIDSAQKVYVGDASANISPSIGGKMLVSNTNMSLNSFANNQHAQTFHFTKSRATSGSGGSIVGSGDFCGHIEWYADDGVDTANQIAKISGQMDGSPGANDTPGKLLFYTTADGANTSTLRMQITNGGVMHIGSTAVSNTIPTGGLDLQGNNTNCVLEMGNPLPNYSAGRVPTFRITTTDADKKVDLSSIWGGDNGIHKHMTLQGGSTIFYNGTNDTEIARITDTGLVVGTTNFSDAHNTDDGTAILKNGHVITRCTSGTNNKLYTAKTIDTGSAIALRVLSAQTQVGSVSFNSGGTSFNTSSDYRRKENVIDLTGAITRLKTLKPKRFNFISNPSVTLDGFLAHEVTAVPEAVIGTKDEVATEDSEDYSKGDPIYQQLDQSKLVPLLVAALQEAVARIEALESP